MSKEIYLIGGYTLKHIYAAIKDDPSPMLPLGNWKLYFFINKHWTQNIHSDFKTFDWGQNAEEFPFYSYNTLQGLKKTDIRHGLTFEAIGEWNDMMEEIMLKEKGNISCVFYEDIEIVVKNEKQQILKISWFDNNDDWNSKEIQLSANTYLLDCRIKPRLPDRGSYTQFTKRVEDFYVESTSRSLPLPYLIMGSGPTALWVFDFLRNQKNEMIKDVKFVTINYKNLRNFATNPRNQRICEDILKEEGSKKYELGASEVVWKVGVLENQPELKAFWEAARDQLIEIQMKANPKNRGLPWNYKDLAVIFKIDPQNNNFTIEFRNVILCIGYDAVTVPIRSNYYKNLVVSVAEQQNDICPVTIRGSVQHQLSKGIRILTQIIDPQASPEFLWTQISFAQSFFTAQDIADMKKTLKLATFLPEDDFFKKLGDEVSKISLEKARHIVSDRSHLSQTAFITAYSNLLDIIFSPSSKMQLKKEETKTIEDLKQGFIKNLIAIFDLKYI